MNLARFLVDAAERRPEQPAITWGDRRLTYGELQARTDALARTFAALGLGKGDRVAVLMKNRPELIETYFAAWKAGLCVVPMNARFVADEIRYHLGDSEAAAVVFDEGYRETIASLAPGLASLKHAVCTSADAPPAGQLRYEDLIDAHAGERVAPAEVSDDDLAWLFYTSGTSGRPKGAMLTHGNLTFATVNWLADLTPLGAGDVGLHAAPLTHGAGFHSLAMTARAIPQVILFADRFDPECFFRTVEEHRITNTWLVPTQIKILLGCRDIERYDLSSLRWIVYGGSPMYVSDLREALRRIGGVFVQLFGQGETPMTGTVLSVHDHLEAAASPDAGRLASCGHVRSGIELRIEGEDGEPLPRGQIGEVCVRGPSVMKGYWRRPEETAHTLRGGWLHTGDVGYMDESGYVYLLDRTKDMIITGGSNVYPREIEEILLRHPAVAEVSIIGVPDPLWGEAVTAVVVPAPGTEPDAAGILAFAKDRMADYKRPKAVHFVGSLPKNAYGKVLKRELRAQFSGNAGAVPPAARDGRADMAAERRS